MEKTDILSLDLNELETALVSLGKKKFRAKQIFQWLHVKRVFDFDKMTDISIQLRERLKENFCINKEFKPKLRLSLVYLGLFLVLFPLGILFSEWGSIGVSYKGGFIGQNGLLVNVDNFDEAVEIANKNVPDNKIGRNYCNLELMPAKPMRLEDVQYLLMASIKLLLKFLIINF